MFVDEFGTEFFDWEPETLNIEVQSTWHTSLPDVNSDKLWALVTLLTTDQYYRSVDAFIHTANALNGSEADFENYDPAEPEEIAWALMETFLIDPPEQKGDAFEGRFTDEIRRYVGTTLEQAGITTPPRILKMAIFDRDPEDKVGLSFGPDEAFVKRHTQRQAGLREEIEQYMVARLQRLTEQLQALPLQHGNTQNLSQYLRQAQTLLAAQLREMSESAEAGPRRIEI
jgi:hypothetical protein